MNNLLNSINNQKFSSKCTSINTTKLPALYKKINWNYWKNKIVFDYGCGRTETQQLIKQFLKFNMTFWKGYDLNWNSDPLTDITQAELIVCANLLNVIEENDIIQDIITLITSQGVPFIIQVYEGDKSKIGKQVTNDSFQKNLPIKDYIEFFNWNQDVIIYKNCIIRKSDKYLLQN
jgi:hypothetical protein